MMKYAILLGLFLVAPPLLIGQDQVKVLYPIQAASGTYDGSGFDWILERADSTQFIMFGEQHGVEGVAEFVSSVYESLQEVGFNYLVLETDGWTTKRSAEIGVIPFTTKNPHSIAFDSNGDLGLMQSAIDNNPEIRTPVWGVDQMQTAIHPFYRLVEIANSSKQRRLARGAFLKASLKMGSYTREDHRKDILALEKVFAEYPNQEKEQIFRELKLTIEIFSKWMNPSTRQESVTIRERLMDQNFDLYLAEAANAKAVFKMGGAHTVYGIGPNGIPSFGDHVNHVARKKNQSVLSIAIRRFSPERSMVSESDFGTHSMLLLDTKAAAMLQPEDSAKLLQNDAIIYLKDAGRANKSINRALEQDFKNNLIARIIPLGLGLLGCIVMFLVSLIRIIARKKYRNPKILSSLIGSLLIVSIAGFQIIQILNFPAYAAAIDTGMVPILIYVLFGMASMVYGYYAFLTFRSNGSTMTQKVGYLLFALSFIMCSYLIYYWNLAGMLT